MTAVGLIGPALLPTDDATGDPLRTVSDQLWQTFQPKTGALAGIVAEIVGLDILIGGSNSCADAANRVFDGDPIDWRLHQPPHKVERLFGQRRPTFDPLVPVET